MTTSRSLFGGTPCAVKAACTVWGGGKAGDKIKGLPIAIIDFTDSPTVERCLRRQRGQDCAGSAYKNACACSCIKCEADAGPAAAEPLGMLRVIGRNEAGKPFATVIRHRARELVLVRGILY